MAYATLNDIQNRYPARDLIALTDPNNQAIQINVITQALGDSSDEMDAFLSRFSLPLANPPAILSRICTDIAIYRMQSLRPLHDLTDVRKRYDDAIAFLTKVSKGELNLGLSADSTEAPPSNPSVRTAAPRGENQFGRGKLRDL